LSIFWKDVYLQAKEKRLENVRVAIGKVHS
jgi:hypothetical protein